MHLGTEPRISFLFSSVEGGGDGNDVMFTNKEINARQVG